MFALNYEDSLDSQAVLKHHRAWAAKFADPLAADTRPQKIDRTRARRLQIGYVSPHFGDHPVGKFMLPLLTHHDRATFDVTCFSDNRRPDDLTSQIKASVESWLDSATLTDAALADQVRQRQIDILVDLTMHCPNNRMLTFARRPLRSKSHTWRI